MRNSVLAGFRMQLAKTSPTDRGVWEAFFRREAEKCRPGLREDGQIRAARHRSHATAAIQSYQFTLNYGAVCVVKRADYGTGLRVFLKNPYKPHIPHFDSAFLGVLESRTNSGSIRICSRRRDIVRDGGCLVLRAEATTILRR